MPNIVSVGTAKSTSLKKIYSFLKGSFLVPFIFATLLYILMRVFFIGVAFSAGESIELYVKTFFITWIHVTAWRLICLALIWGAEAKREKRSITKIIPLTVLRRTAVFLLIATASYAVSARQARTPGPVAPADNAPKELPEDFDPRTLGLMK